MIIVIVTYHLHKTNDRVVGTQPDWQMSKKEEVGERFDTKLPSILLLETLKKGFGAKQVKL